MKYRILWYIMSPFRYTGDVLRDEDNWDTVHSHWFPIHGALVEGLIIFQYTAAPPPSLPPVTSSWGERLNVIGQEKVFFFCAQVCTVMSSGLRISYIDHIVHFYVKIFCILMHNSGPIFVVNVPVECYFLFLIILNKNH